MKTSYKVIGKEYFKNVLPTSKRFKRVLEAYRIIGVLKYELLSSY